MINYSEKSLVNIEREHVLSEMTYLSKRYSAVNFIETGTHLGEAVLFMAKYGSFNNIHSIEISDYFIKFINDNFEKVANNEKIDVSNVKIWKGDSVEVLPSLVSTLPGRSLFWLDAHFSGGDTNKSDSYDCTILKELEIIKSSPTKDHIIVIDDMDCCHNSSSDYPKISEISELILSINKDYLITIKYNVLFAEVPQASMKLSYSRNVYRNT